MTATGIKTNGVGQRCDAHLNLSTSLADADRRPKKGLPLVKIVDRVLPTLRPPFAGYDPTERAL